MSCTASGWVPIRSPQTDVLELEALACLSIEPELEPQQSDADKPTAAAATAAAALRLPRAYKVEPTTERGTQAAETMFVVAGTIGAAKVRVAAMKPSTRTFSISSHGVS